MAINKIKTGSIADSAVTTDAIQDSAITNAKVSPSAAIAQSKVSGLASDISSASTVANNNQFNIGLLGFKMAVNEGLTVFNLIDGVVDEFNDESGTDEAEGSNDYYCGSEDWYTNRSDTVSYSAGFGLTTVTEPDTSSAGTNPTYGSGTPGSFTVPSCISSVNFYLWGAGGGRGNTAPAPYGGGGGFTSGTLAVTPGQVIKVGVGEGGAGALGISQGIRTVGGGGGTGSPTGSAGHFGGGGGVTAIFNPQFASYIESPVDSPNAAEAPNVFAAAGGGGGAGFASQSFGNAGTYNAGVGGGLIGDAGGGCNAGSAEQTGRVGSQGSAGGGSTPQSVGGQGGAPAGQSGGFFYGGNGGPDDNTGGGGAGFYGGGGAGYPNPEDLRLGGGGSSYYGHPQVSSGATEEGGPGPTIAASTSGGATNPNYPTIAPLSSEGPAYVGMGGGGQFPYPIGIAPGTTSSQATPQVYGGDGYVLMTAGPTTSLGGPGGGSTTIVSSSFTSTSVPTSARIVVFEENVDTPTLNTDIIASVSRDGTNFTTATLSDSGYVTGSSGQRILTGQADISGQPSGQSMRWKLALANNTVKIHGVALQWS